MVQLSNEVQLIKVVCIALSTTSNVLDSQHKKQKKIHLYHFLWRSQQRDRVCRQPCTCRPLTCVTTTQAIFRVPLSPAPAVFSERVSHFAHCTGNDIVPKFARFSADVHPSNHDHFRVSPPAVAKELSLTNDVQFQHRRVCICHVLPHCPARVRSRTFQSHDQHDFSDQRRLTGGSCCSVFLSFAI